MAGPDPWANGIAVVMPEPVAKIPIQTTRLISLRDDE